jgi:hypothetical protein
LYDLSTLLTVWQVLIGVLDQGAWPWQLTVMMKHSSSGSFVVSKGPAGIDCVAEAAAGVQMCTAKACI